MSFKDKYNKKIEVQELVFTPEHEEFANSALAQMYESMLNNIIEDVLLTDIGADPFGFKAAEEIREERDEEFMEMINRLNNPSCDTVPEEKTSIEIGQKYYDLDTNNLQIWDGDIWVNTDSQALYSMSAFGNADAEITEADSLVKTKERVVADLMDMPANEPFEVPGSFYIGSLPNGETLPNDCLNWHKPCRLVTDCELNATRFGTGPTGTLVNNGTQKILVIDNMQVFDGDRILITMQSDCSMNGVYDVTHAGSLATNWSMTRTEDYNGKNNDPSRGDAFYIEEGDHYENYSVMVYMVGPIPNDTPKQNNLVDKFGIQFIKNHRRSVIGINGANLDLVNIPENVLTITDNGVCVQGQITVSADDLTNITKDYSWTVEYGGDCDNSIEPKESSQSAYDRAMKIIEK